MPILSNRRGCSTIELSIIAKESELLMRYLLIGLLPPHLGGVTVGGIASITPNWAKHLAAIKGNEVHLWAPVVRQPPADAIAGVTVLPWLFRNRSAESLVRRYGVVNLGMILFDVLLSRSHYLGNALCRYQLQHSRRYFEVKRSVESLRPDVVISYAFYESALIHRAAVRAVDPSIPIIDTVHGGGSQLDADKLEDLSEKTRAFYLSVAREVFADSDYIAFASTYNLEQCKSEGLLDDLSRYGVITDGVDTSAFKSSNKEQSVHELGLDSDYRHILFVGNLLPRKSCHLLVQAFSQVTQDIDKVKLIIVGDGPEKGRLLRQAEALEVGERVRFVGTISNPQEFRKWYQACDLYVLPSKSEGLSISILEAMSSGIPVISCHPVIGVYENLHDGETCLLTEYGNVDQLALAIDRILSDTNLASKLAENAFQLMREEFDWIVRAKAMHNLAISVVKWKRQQV